MFALPSGGFLHALDPFAFELTKGMGIRWYGLSYLTGFFITYLIVRWLSHKGISSLKGTQCGDFIFALALGVVIGGRLGYCLFYSPELLTRFSGSFPYWGGFEINRGGMSSHGGMIGVFISCWWFGRKHGVPSLLLVDFATLGGACGIFFGRLANFVNGELVGRPCSPDFFLSVRFPQDLLLWASTEPERLSTLGPVVSQLNVPAADWNRLVDLATNTGAAWPKIHEIILSVISAVQAGNEQVALALAPLLTPRHPSQLYAAVLEGLLVFLILLYVWRKPRKPGETMSWFFIAYACARIFDEQFRMPDSHIGFQLFGLTRGQWLSIALGLIGCICLLWVRRRSVAAVGGVFDSTPVTEQAD